VNRAMPGQPAFSTTRKELAIVCKSSRRNK
jgi:hypothetical protein